MPLREAIRDDLKLDTPVIAMTAHAMEGERKMPELWDE